MAESTQSTSTLSQQQTAHALRHFILMGVFWAVYGPNAVVSGPVLSGFALKVGLSQAQIGFLASFVGLFGLWQLVASHLTRAVPRKRRMCVALGLVEVTAGSLVVSTALLPEGTRFYAMAGLLSLAYILGNTVNPIFNSWLSNVLPPEVRGNYIGRRMMYISITSIIYLFAASRWLDWNPGLPGFLVVFGVGWVAGIVGYVMMALTPYPRVELEESQGLAGALAGPLRDPAYRALVIFMCTWLGTGMMSGAFYSVYMLQVLGLSYVQVAINTNITLLCMMVSYRMWGVLVQRYGSRPVSQLSIAPYVAALAMWVFVTPENQGWLIPLNRVLAGVCWAGVEIANSGLLYRLVPAGKENSSYFANWMFFVAVGAAGGPFLGGLIRQQIPEAGLTLVALQLNPLQVIFAISAVLCLIPVVLSWRLVDAGAASPGYLLGQLRGNLIGYAYNYALYQSAFSEDRRAGAARGLGRSHTPLALEKLVTALDDVSPQVRSEAARGLGEMGREEAVETLVDELHDDESDIRPEAAEALGRIGSPGSVGPLVAALNDPDPRLRTSAALALGEIGGEEAARALHDRLSGPFEKTTFAAVVDGASRLGDRRIIPVAMEHLPSFRSPVLRMQIINAVCRVLGEPQHFYRLLIADPLSRAGMFSSMTARIVRLLRRAPVPEYAKEPLAELARLFRVALECDDTAAAAEHARKLATAVAVDERMPIISRAAAGAIIAYLRQVQPELLAEEGAIFLVVCLTSLARHLHV
ncbi:MAG: MFS transporter [candidate division WS1 bacterium]|nr:MFS transporter [candidate division WS1 bacterium]